MKFKFIYTFFTLSLLALVFMSNEDGRADSQGRGNTGAPGDETLAGNPRTCVSCHATSASIQMTTEIEVLDPMDQSPVSEYVPGETYRVRVTHTVVEGSPFGYGFQIVSLQAPLDVDGADVAGFSNPASNVKIATANNGRQYAEHNDQSDDPVFEVDWTAPAAGTGPVSFYSCGNAVNDNNMTSGDGAACATLELQETVASSTSDLDDGVNIYLYPNPVFEEMQVRLVSNINAEFSMEIYDMQGRLIINENILFGVGENNFVYNVNNLDRGTYLVKFANEEKIATAKMLKL